MANQILPINLDFTDLDFDNALIRLQQLVAQAFPTWTDFAIANFGNILLQSFAHSIDVLSALQDNHAAEGKIVSARLRRSIISLAKQFGFELPTAVASTVDIKFSIPATIANDIIIPANTIITTNDSPPITYQTLAAGTLLAGTLNITIAAEQSEGKVDTFSANGDPDQSFELSIPPFLDSSTILDVDTLVYTEKANFLDSISTDTHYVIEVDEDDRATVIFGDGVNGVAPLGTVTVIYKIGGGIIGNAEAFTITKLEGTFFDVLSNLVTLSATNPLAAAGGIDRMTVEEARIAIPDSIRSTGSRSVTREDFEINARKTRGVAKALMLTADEDTSIAENTGKLFIVPVGGGLPSSALKTTVETSVNVNGEFPPCATFVSTVEDPDLLIIPVTATVFLDAGADAPTVKTAIEDALDAFFNPLLPNNTPNPQIDFGFNLRKNLGIPAGEIPFSDIFNAVRDVVGVRKVDEDVFIPADDVTLLDDQFPVVGAITLTNGDTALPL